VYLLWIHENKRKKKRWGVGVQQGLHKRGGRMDKKFKKENKWLEEFRVKQRQR